ncbi:predicted protein [Naegleria gruberi]|uniref:Predicted protein n=1 Tax=Naegleria gruberi TaxID=5762 RepID=D2VQX6_NAEGR|nr:uncharacterized protein NAEGRDRAFT_71381 [Naegleria gruberi]EFC40789.1 predicted protein [Naegleria gruberi]|eukprot:XP_002673533.1 predicted protein [Naegleria gruberi strain NEG-M]
MIKKKVSKRAVLEEVEQKLAATVEKADDGSLDDYLDLFGDFNEGLDDNLIGKRKSFFIFDADYYLKRVMVMEAEIVDIIRRRMVPDAKRSISRFVNTYNTISCDEIEWKALCMKMDLSFHGSKSKDNYRIFDRGLEAGSSRKADRTTLEWINDAPNSFLPILEDNRYWWLYKWEHKKKKWRSMVVNLKLVYLQETHKIRIEFDYIVFELQLVNEQLAKGKKVWKERL